MPGYPIDPEEGWSDELKAKAGQGAIGYAAEFFDGLGDLELGRNVETSRDIEIQRRSPSGHVQHVDFTASRMAFTTRSRPGRLCHTGGGPVPRWRGHTPQRGDNRGTRLQQRQHRYPLAQTPGSPLSPQSLLRSPGICCRTVSTFMYGALRCSVACSAVIDVSPTVAGMERRKLTHTSNHHRNGCTAPADHVIGIV